MKENCAECRHHDVFWCGSGCNLLNNGENCKFELRKATAERRLIMHDCGNCANYDRTKKEHTHVCGNCVTAYVNGVRQKPGNWKSLPMTNADRIRAMSDEEMAVFLLSPADLCGQCEGNGEFCTGYPSNNDCRCVNAVKKYLKQPAEGE